MKINILAVILLAGTMFTSCCTTAKSRGKVKKDVAIQLYSIRDTIARAGYNMEPIFKGLSEMGYNAIEAANYGGGKF